MTKSLEDRCEEFSYSPIERAAISDCLPEPIWSDFDDNRNRVFGEPTKLEIAEDKVGSVARSLERTAINFLFELFEEPPPLEDNLRTIDRIAKLSRKLHDLLAQPSMLHGTYAQAFLNTDELRYDKEKFELLLMSELNVIANNAYQIRDICIERRGIYPENSRNPWFTRYVMDIIQFWEKWTNQPAGGSKTGGPAARFVKNTINLVAEFAKTELGIKLRPKSRRELSERTAGELIHYIKKKYP